MEFSNKDGKTVLMAMVKAIQDNKAYLSEIDGLIGDGDHGMNMNKGFTMFSQRISDIMPTFSEGLDELGTLLFSEIGGSMGPIYGTLFINMAESIENEDDIGTAGMADMLQAGMDGLYEIVEARVGDKTLIDTLAPACASLKASADENLPLEDALNKMCITAEQGKESTRKLVAKHGRSARLGERSRGVLDAGATSCCLLLCAMAEGMQQAMRKRG